MSFVYAELTDESLEIYCDTKIILDQCLRQNCSEEQLKVIRQFGIVKTTIICPEISISYAGNKIFQAAKLFKVLEEKKRFTTEEVVDIAYEIHKDSGINAIEFVIASCENDQLSLHCIKDNNVHRNCMIAWLGARAAFEYFQKERLANCRERASEATKMAFQETVFGGCCELVGGFPINAGYCISNKSIEYREQYAFCSSKKQTVKLGEDIRFYMDAVDGGFSYEQIPISYMDLLIRVDQLERAVLYSRKCRMNSDDIANEQLYSFMLPMKVKMNADGNWLRCN